MFHISDDARSRRSAGAVCRALEVLLADRRLSEVSVSALAAAAGVSRTTFYRLFDTTSDVVAYQCQLIVEEALDAAVHANRGSTASAAAVVIARWTEHRALLLALSEAGRLDIVGEVHRANAERARGVIGAVGLDDDAARLLVDVISALIPIAVTEWVRRGGAESPEEVAARVCRAVRMAAV